MSISIRLPRATATFKPSAQSTIAPLFELPIEAGGRAFTHSLLGNRAITTLKSSPSSDSIQGINFNDPKWETLRNANIDHGDYYALLDLADKNVDATEEEIRAKYKIISIVCHPDKARNERRDEAQERYKALQVSYETLTDSARRRAYDSTLPFDDAMPKEKEGNTEKTFYSVYGPVFKRNERYSLTKPCPPLGDSSSSADEVHAFYDFWYSFKSWREFTHLNEHKLESANSREEKRMFMRENEKKQAGAKKEELARIRKLIDDAQRKDPRIARIKAAEEEERKKKKNAKVNAQKQREDEEKARKAEAERLAEIEKQKQAATAAVERDQKKALKSARSYFGKFCREAGLNEDDIEKLKTKLSLDEFNTINNLFKANGASEEAKALFRTHLTDTNTQSAELKQAADEAKAQQLYEAKKAEEEAAKQHAADSQPWSFDEDQLLVKAIVKFPGGVSQRWEKITEFCNNHSHRQRSAKEVIRRQKELESQYGGVSIGVDEAYQKYLLKLKGDQHASELAKVKDMTREQVMALLAEEDAKDKARIAAQVEEERKKKIAAEAQAQADAAAAEADMRAKEKARQEAERTKEEAKKKKKEAEKAAKARAKASSPTPATAPAAAAKAEPAPAIEAAAPTTPESRGVSEEWSADEQAALEKGLKTVSKDAADRWEQISALVGTKSKKQCVARYKSIREQVLKTQK